MVKCILCKSEDTKFSFIDLGYSSRNFINDKGQPFIEVDNKVLKDGPKIYDCNVCQTRFYEKYETHTQDYTDYDKLYPDLQEFCQKVKLSDDYLNLVANRGICYASVLGFLSKQNRCSVLDVGCGYGYVDWVLHKLGFDVTGIDISEASVDFAEETFRLPFYVYNIQEYIKRGEKHDIIISIEVIEHLQEPLKFIQDCLSITNNQFIITTPNLSAYQTIWPTEQIPTHLAVYKKESFEYLRNNLGINCTIDSSSPSLIVTFHK